MGSISAGCAVWGNWEPPEIAGEDVLPPPRRREDQGPHAVPSQPQLSEETLLAPQGSGTSKHVHAVRGPAAVLLRFASQIPSEDPLVPTYMPAFGFEAIRASSNRSTA